MISNKYEYLKNKYSSQINNDIDFDNFLETLLKTHFKNQVNIDYLFNERLEFDTYQSIKEKKLLEKDDILYQRLIKLVGTEHEQELLSIIDEINSNKDDLASAYCKKFYILGLADAENLKLLSFPNFVWIAILIFLPILLRCNYYLIK